MRPCRERASILIIPRSDKVLCDSEFDSRKPLREDPIAR